MKPKILVVDDDASMGDVLKKGLGRSGFEVIWKASADDALEIVKDCDLNAIVTDMQLGGLSGLEFCQRVVENRPHLPVIVITAFGSMDTAIESIRSGAYDFITKPLDVDALALALKRAVKHQEMQQEILRLRKAVAKTKQFDEILGESAPMRQLYALLDRVADSDTNILITGETGTGKELVAKALHNRSQRSNANFVAVNCAAMPAHLLESEFFGHVKGAFTDAKSAHSGIFVQADGGTVFLDEIGELPLELQPKLLRALQERRVRPVGGNSEVEFHVRLITATNRDLDAAVEEKQFREDLLYRVNVIQVPLPPLRARGNDILLLAQKFTDRFATQSGRPVVGLTTSAAEKLLAYSWPGNVRELENCIERAVTLAELERIVVDDLPERIRAYRSSHVVVSSDDPTEMATMHEVERRYITRVLGAVGGNRAQAARVLGFDRKTLYRKLKHYDMPDNKTR
ncbi:sigma-54-dependent transcriptional regulator [Myxococcota bacterium]